jgi:glycerate 2-kinase
VITLCAPDKFRGSLPALAAAEAMAGGATRAARAARALPLADGGEGTLEALGGANRATLVAGPLGDAIEAGWRLADGLAVIELARASGLALLGSAEANDPLAASTRGTGELIAAALDAGAERVIVAVGGSATTDGGAGALEVLAPRGRFGVPVSVACDVATPFLEAADTYAPQKGATPEEVRLLAERLRRLADRYRTEFGLEVSGLPGAGAAGGLAGGLAALGAELVPGCELVAGRLGLAGALAGAELVITGEGRLDRTSFAGKVVGGVLALCAAQSVPVLVVAGEIEPGLACPAPTISLVERFGRRRALAEPAECIADAVADAIGKGPARPGPSVTGRGTATEP